MGDKIMICENCGTSIPAGADTCVFCGQPAPQQTDATTTASATTAQTQVPVTAPVSENMITGIIGAIIGAAIGGAAIILLSRLGYVAAISGAILAVCTLKGYALLGKQLSTKGIIICIILILITPYLADRLDWAIVIRESDPSYTIGEAFSAVPMYITVGAIEMSSYIMNLAMVYIFAAIGAFGTLRDAFRK